MVQDLGKLICRLGFGSTMLLLHGLPKVEKLQQGAVKFISFMGLGAKESMLLAAGSEFICSALIIVGLGTRYASIPLIITMLVAILKVHGLDSLAGIELNILFITGFTALMLLGSGKYSVDYLLHKNVKKRRRR